MSARLGVIPLRGRDAEVGTLRSLVDAAADGTGRAAFVEGEAGIGKTRLLDEVLTYAKSGGLQVCRAAADELGRDRPFGLVADAFGLDRRSSDPQQAKIGRWLAGEDAPTGSAFDLGFRIVEGVTSLLEERSSTQPIAIALEDLQWADLSSLRTVRALAQRLAGKRIALLLTLRPHPRVQDLDRVVESALAQDARHIQLEPLDAAHSSELAADLLNADPGPRLLAQLTRASGNPLFVVELVRALREEGAIDVRDGTAEVGDVSLPASLRATILRRLSVLHPETLDVLKVASVLGSTFSASDLATVAGRSVVDLLSVLTEAVQAGFLGERDERLSFRHDVIREAIYGDIPVPLRMGLHRHCGAALAAIGASAALVAEHVALGAAPGDAEAVRLLHRAAREIALHSASVAARLLERALAIADEKYVERAAVSSDLAYAMFTAGRLADAESVIRHAISCAPDDHSRSILRRCLAQILAFSGDRATALDLLTRNAAAQRSASERATDLAAAALASPFVGDLDGAWTFGHEAVRLGQQTSNRMAVSIAYAALSFVARYRGALGDAVDFGRRALEDPPYLEWGTWLSVHSGQSYPLAVACLEADRLDEADAAFRNGLRSHEERGDIWQCSLHTMGLLTKHYMAGEWDDAAAEAASCLALAAQTESRFIVVIFTNALLAAIDLHRSELGRAERLLSVAEEEVAKTGPQYGVDAMLWVRGLLDEAKSDAAQAVATLSRAWDLFSSFGYQLLHRQIAADLVRLAVDAGNRELAQRVTSEITELGECAVATARGTALRCRGLLDGDVSVLMESVEAFRGGPRPFDLALACEDAGVALGRAGRRDEGVALLDEALGIFSRVGALRDIGRAEAKLRALGARRRRRATTVRPRAGWESLTETELRVVRHVAEGLTNRQIGERLFISRRTVETHVGHAFDKLRVSTRAELAAMVARRIR